MLTTIYQISFFLSLTGLILWFYYQENPVKSRNFSRLFLLGFASYILSIAFAKGEFSYKLLILFRDFMVLGSATLFGNFFKQNQWAFITILILLYGGLFSIFGKKLSSTFPQQIKDTKDQTIIAPPPQTNDSEYDELLVEILEGHQIKELEDLFQKFEVAPERAFYPTNADQTDLDDFYALDIQDPARLPELMAALRKSEAIEWIEENEQVFVEPISSALPTRKKKTFGYDDQFVGRLWGFSKMEVDQLNQFFASNKIKPKKKALIAILDTGVDATHEDIKDNFHSTRQQYNRDVRGHGTHCAGIAAAVSNNKIGIASFAPTSDYVKVTSIKVLADHGGGTQKSIINGIIEAADNGADVISMSLGGRSTDSRQRAYEKAIKYANNKGAIVLAAAGNNNGNAKQIAPANTPGIITVSAIDSNLNRANFSNYVQDVDMPIAAPGVNIYSTLPGNDYKALNGTSMATPYVAGLAGLMKSLNPELTTKEFYKIIKSTGKETQSTKRTGRLIIPHLAVKKLLK